MTPMSIEVVNVTEDSKGGLKQQKKKQKHVEVVRRCQNVWVFVHPVAESVQDGEHFAMERVKLLKLKGQPPIFMGG